MYSIHMFTQRETRGISWNKGSSSKMFAQFMSSFWSLTDYIMKAFREIVEYTVDRSKVMTAILQRFTGKILDSLNLFSQKVAKTVEFSLKTLLLAAGRFSDRANIMVPRC